MDGQYIQLTEEQLDRLISGELDPEAFISFQLDERPAIIFTGNSMAWADFSNLLADENACGDEPVDLLLEMSVISRPDAVRDTAAALARIDQEEFFRRCDSGCLQDKNELWKALELLKAFFAMAADAQAAVIFNVR